MCRTGVFDLFRGYPENKQNPKSSLLGRTHPSLPRAAFIFTTALKNRHNNVNRHRESKLWCWLLYIKLAGGVNEQYKI